MPRPRLLLITAHFPFDRGEEFLETEIRYLAEVFDITIVPWFPDNDLDARRPVPPGVRVNTDVLRAFPVGGRALSAWLLRHAPTGFAIPRWAWRERRQLGMSPALWRQEASFLLQAFRLEQLLAETFAGERFDVLFSYWLSPAALAAARLKARGMGQVAVSRALGGDAFHERSPHGFLPGQALAVQDLDKVFCVSADIQTYLQRRYPEQQATFEVARLSVLPAPVRNSPSQDGRLHIVSCAYMVPVKRLHLLVDALARCDIPVTWTHLGGGGLEAELRARAASLPPNIHWRITGPLPNREIHRFYQEHPVDLFVSVSASEGLPVSMMEAMSYGIPIAATAVGGVPELVEPGQNGYLWDADITPEAIADTLRAFFKLPDAAKRAMREASWQLWHARVNADVQYAEFARRLRALLD
jgi:glycosyltransferase involved in cell wall biosynthesis